jgi:hypothetical protein
MPVPALFGRFFTTLFATLFAILSTLMLSCVTLSAVAFERPFPNDVKRGTMTLTNGQNLMINGKPRAFSGAIQIRNADNLIQMSGSISGNAMPINYTENFQGDIHRVWILTAEEARQKHPTAPPPLPLPQPPQPKPTN